MWSRLRSETESEEEAVPLDLGRTQRGAGKTEWSDAETAQLLALVDDEGQGNWAIVARRLATRRTAGACQQQWNDITGSGPKPAAKRKPATIRRANVDPARKPPRRESGARRLVVGGEGDDGGKWCVSARARGKTP